MGEFPFQGRAGAESAADGSYQPFRVGRQGEIVTSDVHGRNYESVRLGNMYYLNVGPTTTGIGAGHVVAASAAAAVQLALINPSNSGRNLSLVKFGWGIISGTAPAGPAMHGIVTGCTLTASVTTSGSGKSCLLGSGLVPAALTVAVAASSGQALTGGAAVVKGPLMNFSSTGTAQASVGEVGAVDDINGSVVVAPGCAWVPLFPDAGTSVLSFMSIVWEEIPA